NTPLCSLNKDYKNTIEFLAKLGIKYFTCSGLIPTGNTKSDESKELVIEKEELLKALDEALEYAKANELDIQFTSPGILTDEELNARNLIIPSCGAGVSNMAVLPNGEVIPCQSWLKGEKLGSALNYEWCYIWDDKLCRKIRKEASKNTNICLLRGGVINEENN
ncbi:MAG: SPASM domain-containing protein, partial [Bacilli bacterium]|nr:SPASM domain-containing protein [Bacilli bacterium]